jgi:hypothetical protein
LSQQLAMDEPGVSPAPAPAFDESLAKALLIRALEAFFAEPGMPADVNERAATHRIALHLEREVRALSPETLGADPVEIFVDCEYNRQGTDAKRLTGLAIGLRRLARRGRRSRVMDTRGTTVFPDIIVHRRGREGPNLLVVEVKRSGVVRGAVAFDQEKLRLYKSEHRYDQAFLVTLGTSVVDSHVAAVGTGSHVP